MFEHEGSDETDDSAFVGKDSDDLGAPFDLAVEPLDGVCAGDLGPVLLGEGGVGRDVLAGGVRQVGPLRRPFARNGQIVRDENRTYRQLPTFSAFLLAPIVTV